MSSGYSDNLNANGNKLKGEVKESYGNATNNPKLQTEGKMDKAKGYVQEKLSDAKEKISEKLDIEKKSIK